jgi:acyl carrier protein
VRKITNFLCLTYLEPFLNIGDLFYWRYRYKGEKIKELIDELKTEIVETLGLADISASDIDENERLVGGNLGIDSIDTLELIIMMEKKYGVKVPNVSVGREVFSSVASMAKYISENKK